MCVFMKKKHEINLLLHGSKETEGIIKTAHKHLFTKSDKFLKEPPKGKNIKIIKKLTSRVVTAFIFLIYIFYPHLRTFFHYF